MSPVWCGTGVPVSWT